MKIEQKGSLWECIITSDCYSDKNWDIVIVSGNSYDEAKNALKIFYKNKEEHWKHRGLVFILGGGCDETVDEQYQYREGEGFDDEMDWDTDYGNAERVHIHRLSVVYTDGEIAKPSLHLNSPTDDAPAG